MTNKNRLSFICNFQRTKFFEKKLLTKWISQGIITYVNESGDDGVEETLLSIPNRTVKLYSADGTSRETVRESRTLPG